MNRDYNRCKICGEWHWSDTKCDPIYYVQIPCYHGYDEWVETRACSHSSAAEIYCDRHDAEGDYVIISNGGIDEIFVKDATGNVKKFSVEAETVPEYTASEIK